MRLSRRLLGHGQSLLVLTLRRAQFWTFNRLLQCPDIAGWATGRASSLEKCLSDGMLVVVTWLELCTSYTIVTAECHHSPPPSSLASVKPRMERDILVPANPGCLGKWPSNKYCCHTEIPVVCRWNSENQILQGQRGPVYGIHSIWVMNLKCQKQMNPIYWNSSIFGTLSSWPRSGGWPTQSNSQRLYPPGSVSGM